MMNHIRFSLALAVVVTGSVSQPDVVWMLTSFGAPSPTTIELRWVPPLNTTGFSVARNGAIVAQLPPTATSFTDSGLMPATAYSYQVQADRMVTKGPAKMPMKPKTVSLTVVTPPVLPPRDLQVTVTRPAEVEVTWSPAAGAVRYLVQRDGVRLPTVTSPSIADSGLTPGRHVYTVQAVYRGMKPGPMKLEPTFYTSAPGLPAEVDIIWGFAEMHAHQFVNLGFGGLFVWGRVFDRRGMMTALPNCDYWPKEWSRTLKSEQPGLFNLDQPIPAFGAIHGAGGRQDLVGSLMSAVNTGDGSVVAGHGVQGANAGSTPQFADWPKWNALSHQMMYWELLKRAYDGGLRLMVTHAVNSKFLCSVINHVYTCDDMPAVDRQVQAAHDLEAYVDSLYGGPGRGWYRIVRTPQEARAAIANNQLAVVLGIEVPDLFDCATDRVKCTPQHVKAQLDKYYGMGVRHLFPIHSIDNAFGGTAFFQDIYRIAQVKLTGADFTSRDCSDAGVSFTFDTNAFMNKVVALVGSATGAYPSFNGAANCNSKGLGAMAPFLFGEMKARGMLIDADHMSLAAREQAFAWARQNAYPLVSSHPGILDTSYGKSKRHEAQQSGASLRTIFDLGGTVGLITAQGKTGGPGLGDGVIAYGTKVANNCSHSSRTFAQAYLAVVDALGGNDRAAVAFGTDMQGAIHQPGPRFGDEACTGAKNRDAERQAQGDKDVNGVRYPFQYQGMKFPMDKSQMFTRKFDVNEDGLSHVGMLPDFIADLLAVGLTADDLKPLFRSAESYIETWEKTVGTTRSTTAPASTIHLELVHSAQSADGGTVIVHAADWRTGAAIRTPVYLDGEKAGVTGMPITYRHRADGRPIAGFVLPDGHPHPRGFELHR